MIKTALLTLLIAMTVVCGYSQSTNIDFQAGNLNGWTLIEGNNDNSETMSMSGVTASSQYSVIGQSMTEINNLPISMTSPLGGNFIRIGNAQANLGGRTYRLSQTFSVSSVSPALAFSYASVLQDGAHICEEQPFFNFLIKDAYGNIIQNSNIHSTIGGTGCTSADPSYIAAGLFNYKDWTNLSYDMTSYIGTAITVEVTVGGCVVFQGAHPGYAYFDAAFCTNTTSPNYVTVNGTPYNLIQADNYLDLCGLGTVNIQAPPGATTFSWTGGAINGLTTQSVSVNQPGLYKLVYNKPSACSNSTSVSFRLGSTPTVSVTGPTLICSATSATLAVPVGIARGYTWTPINAGLNQVIGHSSTYIVSPSVTTVYKATVADSAGCSNSATYTLNVTAPPLVTATGFSQICAGSSLTLTASGADTYTWSSGATTNSIVVTPTVNTTYTVNGKSLSTGCLGRYKDTVKVILPVGISSGALKLCIGDSITVWGTGATSYTWSTGAITSSVSLKPTTTTTYTLSGITSCGIQQSVFTVTVNALPVIPIASSLGAMTVCKGDVIQLSASGINSFLWSTGGTSNYISVTPSITTTYSVSGRDANGCKNNASATVTVVPAATITVSSPTVLCSGQTATLTANGATTFTWNTGSNAQSIIVTPTVNTTYNVMAKDVNGCGYNVSAPISVFSVTPTFTLSATTATYCAGQIGNVTIQGANYLYSCTEPNTSFTAGNLKINPVPAIPTVYTVTANSGCAITSQTILINPNSSPTVSINGPTVTCSGAPVSYTASGATTYTWNVGLGIQGQIFSDNPTVSRSYQVTGTTNGCNMMATILVTVNPVPVVSIAGSTICSGASATLSAGAGMASYTWNTGAVTSSIVVSPTSGTGYSVIVTNTNNCSGTGTASVTVNANPTISVNSGTVCLGNIFTMMPSGATTYIFSNGAPMVTPTVNTTYTVSGISAQGCISSNTVVSSVSVVAVPLITVNSGSICPSETFTMNPSGGVAYIYSNGSNTVSPAVNSTYTVTGSNISGCVNTAVSNVAVVSSPVISVNSGTICSGDNFTILPTGGTTYTYSGGSAVVSPSITTDYTITANAAGCAGTNTIVSSVTVNQLPLITVNSGTLCSGQAFNLNPSGALTYTYSSGSNTVTPLVNSTYTVTGTDANGCVGIALSTLTVSPLPAITVNSGSICSGESFTFTPAGANTYTYSSGSDIITPFSDITVTVTGTDSNGCTDNTGATGSVTVNAGPVINITGTSTVCTGSSASLVAAGANSYAWSNGATTASINVTPTLTETYTVTGTGSNACSTTQTVSIILDNTCQEVWPGDANSDGIADNLDVLELGLHYTQTGPARTATSNSWQSWFANNWSGTLTNGQNLNHSDCNGDGTINNDDTLAIYNNYGLTHAFKGNQQTVINPQLTIVPDQPAVVKGTWGTASVYLGEAVTPVNDINGIAFTVNFDNTLIETNSVWIEYPTSFINASNQNLHFRKLDFASNNLYTATTHTVSNNVNGNGFIAKLHYQIKSTLSTDEILNLGIVQANQSNASGVIIPLTSGTSTLMAIGASVGLNESSIANLISVSPNPATSSVLISSTTELEKVEIVNLTGQVLISETVNSKTHRLNIENVSNGVYFVKVHNKSKQTVLKKLVIQK